MTLSSTLRSKRIQLALTLLLLLGCLILFLIFLSLSLSYLLLPYPPTDRQKLIDQFNSAVSDWESLYRTQFSDFIHSPPPISLPSSSTRWLAVNASLSLHSLNSTPIFNERSFNRDSSTRFVDVEKMKSSAVFFHDHPPANTIWSPEFLRVGSVKLAREELNGRFLVDFVMDSIVIGSIDVPLIDESDSVLSRICLSITLNWINRTDLNPLNSSFLTPCFNSFSSVARYSPLRSSSFSIDLEIRSPSDPELLLDQLTSGTFSFGTDSNLPGTFTFGVVGTPISSVFVLGIALMMCGVGVTLVTSLRRSGRRERQSRAQGQGERKRFLGNGRKEVGDDDDEGVGEWESPFVSSSVGSLNSSFGDFDL